MLDLNLFGAPAFMLQVSGGDVRYASINDRLAALTGLRSEDVVGRTPHECLPAAAAQAVAARYAECVAEMKPVTYEDVLEMPSGIRCYRTTLTPIYAADAWRVTSIIGVTADVTELRKQEFGAREALARAELALEVIEGGFWHYDIETRTFETSKGLGQFIAGKAQALDLPTYLSHVSPEDLDQTELKDLVEGRIDESVAEYRLSTRDRGVRWMRCKRRLLRTNSGEPSRVVGVAFDVTDQKIEESRLERQAQTDPLTGVANRREFDARADAIARNARRTGRSFGILLVDLDHFKDVNDLFGHAAGDDVLRDTTRILLAQARPSDVVARIGGDEFAIILEGVDATSLTRVAQRVSQNLMRRQNVHGREIDLSASVGGALSSADTSTISDLLARADAELYRVKSAGRASWRLAA